jgi:hypothetical protein
VSAVDQLYLPIAMERIASKGEPPDIGYVGTTIDATVFRTKMEEFTGIKIDPINPQNWPVYNNPTVNGKKLYPDAGIRVPSTYNVLALYANPSFFKAPLQTAPVILPSTPPTLVQGLMTQWESCTTGTGECPQSAVYQEINRVFLRSYKRYIEHGAPCTIPSFLKPVTSNPPSPKLTTFLSYVYGWVPFNFDCPAPDLPTPNLPPSQFGDVPIDYINLQYNYKTMAKPQWLNSYTQFIHGDLGATPYAFSIDDSNSAQNNAGDGLILAVGGDNGLPNNTQVPPAVPLPYPFYTFELDLQAPSGPIKWAKYGICSADATIKFPADFVAAGGAIGVTPKAHRFPCTITLTDTADRKYQITIPQAASQAPFWEPWPSRIGIDPNVVKPDGCSVTGRLQWCQFINEIADPAAPKYALLARGPVQ